MFVCVSSAGEIRDWFEKLEKDEQTEEQKS